MAVTGATAEFAERLARRRRRGSVLLWSGLVLLPVTVATFFGLDAMYSARQSRLVPQHGGRIVSVSETSEDDSAGTVTVESPDGLQFQDVPVGDTSEWPVGSRATLLVDPDDPSFVTLRGENYLPGWFGITSWVVPSLAAWLACIGAGLRSSASRARTRLATGSWQRSEALVVAAASEVFVVYLPAVDGGSFWVADKDARRLGSPVDVAGGFDTGLVLREVGSDRFVLAQPGGGGRRVEVEECWWTTDGGKVAVRVAAGDEAWVVEVPGGSLAAVLGDAQRADVELRVGPHRVAALLVGADRSPVLGRVVPEKRARRRWPDLEPR